MAGGGQSPKKQKPSIKYKHNRIGGEFYELTESNREDYAPSPCAINQLNGKKYESKSAEIVRTSDLISAIGHLWDTAVLPPVLKSKVNIDHHTMNLKKGNTVCYPTKGHIDASTSAEGQYLSVNVLPASHSLPASRESVECLKAAQKLSFFKPGNNRYVYSCFWTLKRYGFSNPIESCMDIGEARLGNDIGEARLGNLHKLKDIYRLLSETTPARPKHLVNFDGTNKMQNQDCCNTGQRNSTCSNSSDATLPSKSVRNANCLPETVKASSSLSVPCMESSMDKQTYITSVCSVHCPQAVEEEEIGSVTSISQPHACCCSNPSPVDPDAYNESQHNPTENHLLQTKNFQQNKIFIEDNSKVEVCLLKRDITGFARQEHAFAGAFAGVFVSLCLHPVDTIKTVTQSCRCDQKSILDISRSIITDRGLTGLYRGIASNIAASAPISAVYTFTYESVKGTLLPYFSKECHSLAHCVAGGSASIATSVIFTPSERIKQQMQVSSRYQSSWNALLGIVGKGGISSLYAGWGAVLCRNVPHSIIKFYTYERLKQLTPSSIQSNGQKEMLRTLVCGGLSGSTAALFTTPFDVVKTRLQTQIPGSTNQFNGVFSTLVGIAKHEGLKGLYRGLTPRLLMYMTQGSLFFASYESCRKLFSVETAQGRLLT